MLSAASACVIAVGTNAQTLGTAELVFPNGNTYAGVGAVKVELWIEFGPEAFAWATWKGGVSSNDVFASWASLSSPSYVVVASPGTPNAGVVNDISVGQVHFPPIFIANTANPILIWSAEWSTSDLTPRSVLLMPDTHSAKVFIPGGGLELVLNDAQASIQVIPAPPSLAFLALASGLASRRRRARAQGRVFI